MWKVGSLRIGSFDASSLKLITGIYIEVNRANDKGHLKYTSLVCASCRFYCSLQCKNVPASYSTLTEV